MSPATQESLWRAFEACRRYAEIDARIKQIGRTLGDDRCLNLAPERRMEGMPYDELEFIEHVCCLDRLYRHRKSGGWREKEPSLCKHCQKKDDLIQERKQLRQRLGAAKREIIRVGKRGGFDA